MTKREAMNAIINGEMNEELVAWATEEVAKLDKANENRKGKQSNATKANAEIREKAIAYVAEHEGCMREEIATALGISPQKVSALLAKNERIVATDTKVVDEDGKKHQRKAYALAK